MRFDAAPGGFAGGSPERSDRRWRTASLACAAALLIAGCVGAGSRTTVERSAASLWPTEAEQLDFVDGLRGQAIVSNADALHALLLFAGEPVLGGWSDSLTAARRLGWVGPGVELAPNASAEVGMVMAAITRISDVGLGGAGLLVANDAWSPGALVGVVATKRGRRLGLLPDRSANQALTGAEMLALLRRAEVYERSALGATSADELPGP